MARRRACLTLPECARASRLGPRSCCVPPERVTQPPPSGSSRLVHDELHRLARRIMGAQRPDHKLPTALVHEAYLRLVDTDAADAADRVHFMRVAAPKP